jgi:YbgC/YbaW family acyl-CoA thioester hydrolase
MEASFEIVVRCTEIDVNGHVNNAKYVEYLEWAREEWYDRRGLTHNRLEAMGAITVTVNISIDYKAEAGQGDVLAIETRPARVGRTSFAFAQVIRRGETLVASASVTMVTIDPETRRPRPVPEELAGALRAELAEAGGV